MGSRQPLGFVRSECVATQSGVQNPRVTPDPARLAPGSSWAGRRGHNDCTCRNIRPLNNFEPPATDDEVHAAALQYVRKVAGTTKPSKANQEAFDRAVEEIAHITRHLVDDLVTTVPPKDREAEAAKARARAQQRYAS